MITRRKFLESTALGLTGMALPLAAIEIIDPRKLMAREAADTSKVRWVFLVDTPKGARDGFTTTKSIALCMLTYSITMETREFLSSRQGAAHSRYPSRQAIKDDEVKVIRITARYLLYFMIFAISLELLDLIFHGYTAVKSWDVLRSVIYGKDFKAIFVLQYGIGNLIPLILLLLPGLTTRRAALAVLLVLFGVFMIRWSVVIGGQTFSLSFADYMHYHLPIIPHYLGDLQGRPGRGPLHSHHALSAVLSGCSARFSRSLRRFRGNRG